MEIVETRRQPKWAAGAYLLILAGLVAAFAHNFAEMWIRWFPYWNSMRKLTLYERIVEGESYYTHGPIVPLVSLIITILLIRHTRIPVQPRPREGSIVLGISLLAHLVGCLARVNFVSGLAFIGVLCGLVLLLWGDVALRRLWFPIALLIFMVPVPDFAINHWNFRLKMIAAEWGVRLSNAGGIVVERSGNRVFLEGGKSLVIANVCNGLRTIISLLAFGALYVYVCRLKGVWRVVLFAMTIPVAVASNTVRIVSLIVVADVWDAQVAIGWFHGASGIMIFVLAFLLMFGIERLILWVRKAVGRPATVTPLFQGVRRGDGDERQWERIVQAGGQRAGLVAGILVVLAAGGAWWLGRTKPSTWTQQMARSALPAELHTAEGVLSSYDLVMDELTLTILETRDYLYRRYVGAAAVPVELCVIFSQDNRKGTHPPDICLEGSGGEIVSKGEVLVGDVEGAGSVPCHELVVQFGRETQYCLYTYKCGKKYTGSFLRQQVEILANGLLNRNASGALIRVTTQMNASVEEARGRSVAFLRLAMPYLHRALP